MLLQIRWPDLLGRRDELVELCDATERGDSIRDAITAVNRDEWLLDVDDLVASSCPIDDRRRPTPVA